MLSSEESEEEDKNESEAKRFFRKTLARLDKYLNGSKDLAEFKISGELSIVKYDKRSLWIFTHTNSVRKWIVKFVNSK